jgi:alpha-beta hydrolase superfamily lysophospholipase
VADYAAFDGAEGRISYRVWPIESPHQVVILAHGYGEHIGRYEHVATALVSNNSAVAGPDHIGHGKSDGERALITDFEHVVDDLHHVTSALKERHPGRPAVLIGHSLGGLIAARYAQRHATELAGLVLSGPVLGSWAAVTSLLALPEIPDDPIDVSTLSRDPAIGAAYLADPLVYHGPYKQQMIRAIAATLQVVNTGPGLGDLPTLWLHGQEDRLVPLTETRAGIQALAPERLTTRIYRGARHEVYNETNSAEVLRDTAEFIEGLRH